MTVPQVRRVIDGPTMRVEIDVNRLNLSLTPAEAAELSDLLLDAALIPDTCRGKDRECENLATEPDGLCPECAAWAEDVSDRTRDGWRK